MSTQSAVYWNMPMAKRAGCDTLGDQFMNMVRAGRLAGMVKRLHRRAASAFHSDSGRCPDGESHHPSVCLRGWRGDVCSSCPFCQAN